MSPQPIDLLLLDAHGVVLNNPLRDFLRELAEFTGQQTADVLDRWYTEIRIPAWTGVLGDDELWTALSGSSLVGGLSARAWSERLEAHYAPGPAAPHLATWREHVPVWLLSNHRTHWLMPRLERFGLLEHLDRVIVSDDIRAAKPDPRAFDPVLRDYAPERVLFVDDQVKNIRVAHELDLRTVLAEGEAQVGRDVGRILSGPRVDAEQGALR
ncbi:MAG: HAD family hydrolase [Planctomycetota bacterium]|nr:HAD family hydrolase [Planctomycetota bacterium]